MKITIYGWSTSVPMPLVEKVVAAGAQPLYCAQLRYRGPATSTTWWGRHF